MNSKLTRIQNLHVVFHVEEIRHVEFIQIGRVLNNSMEKKIIKKRWENCGFRQVLCLI